MPLPTLLFIISLLIIFVFLKFWISFSLFRKYIERKEITAKRKMQHNVFEEEEECISEGMEFEGPQESIMMVDSSFFSSGASKTPIGPTIMNAEPDGFMVPEKVSLGTHSQQQKKKR